uniref:MIF4G domain-containing protein n=1 Tax=Meloidogyne hapla TaxID=6305 RepID=A0A1I8BPP6_MELHA
MSGERAKARRSAETDSRDKRFLGSIQSILDPGRSVSRPRPNGTRKKSLEAPKECNNINDALESLNLSNSDVCVSLADVKSFLQKNSGNLTESDYSKLATILCDAALEQNDIYFVLDICTELIDCMLNLIYPKKSEFGTAETTFESYMDEFGWKQQFGGDDSSQHFQTSFSTCLKDAIGKFLNEEESKLPTLPTVLAQLLVNKWPRKFNRALESSNLVLFTIFNTIIGWIGFLNEISKKNNKQEANNEINHNLFLKCVEGIATFCDSGQKSLWLNSPELFDDIYNVCFELLVNDNNSIVIPRSLKSSLLNLCFQQRKWSQANTPKYFNVSTQTISTGG